MSSNYNKERYLPIEDYGIIGNLHTVALVSLNGSIDYMSFRRFDAPTIFCRLLDADKGGFFSITPVMENMITKQLYMPDTNVLLTRFFSEKGIVEITDYMPVEGREINCSVVRKISTIRGSVDFDLCCAPRFNYARSRHTMEETADGILFKPEAGSQPPILLQSEVPLRIKDKDVVANFTLNEGETTCFLLQAADHDSFGKNSLKGYVETTYHQTMNFWQSWISQAKYTGRWEEVVRRSALTLKLLISEEYGSMIAAPTFSLPEAIGEQRNWDYRYTWVRDAAFSMHAFLELGFLEEAERFLQWIRKQSSEENLQLMFRVDGDTHIDETFLDMEGYKGSKPVRIGNDAHKQTQMDIFGELLETIYIFTMHGGDITYDYWKIIEQNIEYVIKNWKKPDHSIWEVRGEKREFLFTKIMCWVAIDRAIKVGNHFSFPYDMLRWNTARNTIYTTVYNDFWSEERNAFVQYKGSQTIDASAMMMPILNMISPHSEKWKSTMHAIRNELSADVLVYRYREGSVNVDGMKGTEGTFTMCSFWYVECLALAGEREKAVEYFEKVLGYANHLGLYSEQLGIKGEHLGNFPQAFTHLALISAAIQLNDTKKMRTSHIRNPEMSMK